MTIQIDFVKFMFLIEENNWCTEMDEFDILDLANKVSNQPVSVCSIKFIANKIWKNTANIDYDDFTVSCMIANIGIISRA